MSATDEGIEKDVYLSLAGAFENACNAYSESRVNNRINDDDLGNIPPSSDEEIRSRIMTVLTRTPDIDASYVAVRVDRGLVSLEGSVAAYWTREHAEYLARLEPGVIHVRNHLAVVPSHDYEDQVVARDIVSALGTDAFLNEEDVIVHVERDVVTLIGTVSTALARRAVIEAALNTAGVMGVRDALFVAAPQPPIRSRR